MDFFEPVRFFLVPDVVVSTALCATTMSLLLVHLDNIAVAHANPLLLAMPEQTAVAGKLRTAQPRVHGAVKKAVDDARAPQLYVPCHVLGNGEHRFAIFVSCRKAILEQLEP